MKVTTETINKSDVAGGILLILLGLVILVVIAHALMWSLKTGLPREDTSLLRLTFDTDAGSGAHVFGTEYHATTDGYGNCVVVIENPYEAGLFGWRCSAERKSFYYECGSLDVKYVNPDYVNPDNVWKED